MQVNLKQKEIEAALRDYVANQGLSLIGKTIDIQFTAGRKEAGISAEIDIQDAGGPLVDASPIKPLKVEAEAATADVKVEAKPASPLISIESAEGASEEPKAEAVNGLTATDKPAKVAGSSLFG